MSDNPSLKRALAFCEAFNLRAPILMAPMGSASPTSLAIAVANAGGLGGCGAVRMEPDTIKTWASDVRAATNGGFQMNLWIPDPTPRDTVAEDAVRNFLANWGPPVDPEAGNFTLPDFAAQCEAMLEAGPPIISSIMGLYPDDFVKRMKAKGIRWFATATTVAGKRRTDAGADVIIVQGMEAGGHRGAFDATKAEAQLIGLFSLLPAVADAVKLRSSPLEASVTGAAWLPLCCWEHPTVQVGTASCAAPEAKTAPAWANAIGRALPEDTTITKWFSGRPGRSITTAYVRTTADSSAPAPAPYPVQWGLTQGMREGATRSNEISGIWAWAGQSAKMARAVAEEMSSENSGGWTRATSREHAMTFNIGSCFSPMSPSSALRVLTRSSRSCPMPRSILSGRLVNR